MAWGFDDLLLNILFILFFLLFVPLILDQINTSHSKKKWIMIVSFNLAVISCMIFPIIYEDGILADLRYLAVLVGGLYGGWIANVSLLLTNIIFRFVFDGPGTYTNIILATLHFLLITFTYRQFKLLSKTKKIIFSSTLALLSSAVTIGIILIAFDNFITIYTGLFFIVLQTLCIALIIYITEIMRETRMLKIRTEKMELVSQLASSISHEVRNPLTVVRGFLQLLQQVELPKKKKEEYVKLAISEIDRAESIIGDYLTFAKPSKEKEEFLNTKEELERALEVIKPLANMNSVAIETAFHPCWIRGDKQLFQQCLLNITKNCIEAMPNGGTLRIHTHFDGNKVVIHVSDNGIGMTEEQQRRLGEPYYTTKGKKGTGLGMMVAFRIIENFNGSISVSSELHKGTTFTLCLPTLNTDTEEVASTKE
ncbi:ATP-binding protein [Evansella cellulosilytica]|uniref:histidine kinase n=1 Tax=Evansella cellulosilytica (strain ATCC 21833 / DSM 2522 / FERM P-1141 / JCM 9156 / N-4) TaxID=649639 RepID=E6U1C2_EVAC2|nr:ATP-binding protein [Evansella cellulosilytica]ADU29169.1 integral membrane sensor signal transduction histidine kinase [Evansella cellulosilytica DSM 2522]